MIRTAVIGLGVIGGVHISAIRSMKNAVLAAACDIDASKKDIIPVGVNFYKDIDELILKEKLDAAHICLPHFLHYPAAKKLAEAGINIFTEKPLALNAEEGEKFCELEKKHKVKICLCLQNRLNTTTEALFRLLQSGEYGKVTGIHGSVAWYRSKEYYEAGPWRGIMAESGGGCMINQAIHTLDLMQYFAQSPAVSVKGNISQVLDYNLEVEDTASARIEFENGAVGFFSASIANYKDEAVNISIRCEKGEFLMSDDKLFIVNSGKQELLAVNTGEYAGKQVYGSSHAVLIERFYDALEGKDSAYIHAEEGLASLRLIDAIRRSSESGKTVAVG